MMNISLLIKFIIYLMSFSFLFGLEFYLSRKNKEFFWWNQDHNIRLFLFYILFLIYCLLYYKLPFMVIPLGFFAMVLILFSNKFMGYVLYLSGICFYGFLFDFSLDHIGVMLLTGLSCGILCSSVVKTHRLPGALLTYLIFDFSVYFILFIPKPYDIGEFLLYSCIRIVISGILTAAFLKYILCYVIEKNDNFYSIISDPEHELLIRLKFINEAAYFHAVHTAYLADKIAKKIGANASLSKALGYYHRIGLIQGEDTIQNTLTVAGTYRFSTELQTAMKEYGIKDTDHVSKEAAIVQICDAFVSSLTYLFQKDMNANINYEKIVDVIIKKKLDCDDLAHCELTLNDLTLIKKAFVEEKLYYDFLR